MRPRVIQHKSLYSNIYVDMVNIQLHKLNRVVTSNNELRTMFRMRMTLQLLEHIRQHMKMFQEEKLLFFFYSIFWSASGFNYHKKMKNKSNNFLSNKVLYVEEFMLIGHVFFWRKKKSHVGKIESIKQRTCH